MLLKIWTMWIAHFGNNKNTYLLLFIVFAVGVSIGAFTINGLSPMQSDELTNYFHGFLQLFDNHNIDGNELFKISTAENLKVVAILWALGVTIIGIPFIFVIIGIRGFITGFCAGFVIKTIGVRGVLFIAFSLLPRELVVVPCILALGVNGINFSLNIIKNKSIKHISKENLKKNFMAYCFVTMFYSCFIFTGILIEAYIIPVLIRTFSSIITK